MDRGLFSRLPYSLSKQRTFTGCRNICCPSSATRERTKTNKHTYGSRVSLILRIKIIKETTTASPPPAFENKENWIFPSILKHTLVEVVVWTMLRVLLWPSLISQGFLSRSIRHLLGYLGHVLFRRSFRKFISGLLNLIIERWGVLQNGLERGTVC